ncbi:MAG: lipoyl(octanoyl) transferase LipB [Fimbriimonadaceae bacterium]|nr:lipoyl(octanoyl) transferase LipB [Fimbriimonadaceae bacterium]
MTFAVRDLGRCPYADALAIQESTHAAVLAGDAPPTLLLTEHPPVLTLGADFHAEHLRWPESTYAERGIDLVRVHRGGDVTYHGPGQLVAYPIFPLAMVQRDVIAWLRGIECVVIQTVAHFGLTARRFPPHTGVWIGDRKVCAIGIRIQRAISMHGFALNCSTDLTAFDSIVPCGIADFGVTSLSVAAERVITVDDAKPVVIQAFESWIGGPSA